jgi:hypothetical protein
MYSDLLNSGKATISRLRRIRTGEEVVLTLESVEELARAASEPEAMFSPFDTAADLQPPVEVANYVTPSIDSDWDHILPLRPNSPNVASGLSYRLPSHQLVKLDPFSILPETSGEPIPKELLIRYCQSPNSSFVGDMCSLITITDIERLAPWLSYLDDRLTATTPRLAWLPFALQHTPFFHATLLAAAVHLNRRRPLRDKSALLWFKVQTIRYANERMNLPPSEAASDEMIMVALVLLYFNVRTFLCTVNIMLTGGRRQGVMLRSMRSI